MSQGPARKLLVATTLCLVATFVDANGYPPPVGGEFDYAQVMRVEPLSRVVQTPLQQEECWDEPVTYYQPVQGPMSYTPPLMGGIVGAVVGNQFGKGSGRDWSTVAGAALGASVGRDYAQQRAAYGGGVAYAGAERRCRVVQTYAEQTVADGFRVLYSYGGRQFETRLPYDPGPQLRVRVDVVPAP
jgi:uncharacterized protein YcfJ